MSRHSAKQVSVWGYTFVLRTRGQRTTWPAIRLGQAIDAITRDDFFSVHGLR
jgi:hypothetical protein